MTEKRLKYWARTLRRLRAECYEALGCEGDYLDVALMKTDEGEDSLSITARKGEDEEYPYAHLFGNDILKSDF